MDNRVELSDFSYVEYRSQKIFCNKCIVLKECAVFLYSDAELITIIEEKIEDIHHVDVPNGSHYYLKNNGSPIYVVKRDGKQRKNIKINDVVIRNDENDGLAWKLFYIFKENKEKMDSFDEEIKSNYGWTVLEVIHDRYVKIQRGDVEQYTNIEMVFTLESIKESAYY